MVAQVSGLLHLISTGSMALELILTILVREWLDARKLVSVLGDFENERKKNALSDRLTEDRSIVTGFYALVEWLQVRYGKVKNEFNFGFDFTSDDGHQEIIIEGYLDISHIKEHLHSIKISLHTLISESEIRDKGKADNLIKGMLAFQALRLTIQCIGLAVQQLTITPLELSDLHACLLCYSPWHSGGGSHITLRHRTF